MPLERDVPGGFIRPTLFLGLGGTGKEVLLRLRRKFYDALGVPGLPCTAYLWLDTDMRDCMAAGEKIGDKSAPVAFCQEEKIALLEGPVGADLANVVDNPEHWPHVHEWLYPEVARYGTQIADGAAAVRALGRLTYFNHFREIDMRLNAMIARLSAFESITATKAFFKARNMGTPDFPDGAAVQVVVVASLAGGTGSGIFLDAAFHLARMAQAGRRPIERVIGIFFMPNVFYGGAGADELSQRSYANAYAALKELEFFTVRRGDPAVDAAADFRVEWEPGKPVRVQGPPFAISYVVEMKNEAGLVLNPSNRAELFDMVAETLFLDFMPGQFSTAKRAHYWGVAQYLASQMGANIAFENVSLPQAFARRYASFGMAKIEIPMDRLKAACAAQLASEIAGYINRPLGDPNIRDTMRADQISCGLDADRLPARFGAEWKAMIRAGVAKAMPREALDRLDQIPPLEAALAAAEAELVFAEGAAPERWGKTASFLRARTKGWSPRWRTMCTSGSERPLTIPRAVWGRWWTPLAMRLCWRNASRSCTWPRPAAARRFSIRRSPVRAPTRIFCASTSGICSSRSGRRFPAWAWCFWVRAAAAVDLLLNRLREAEEGYCLARAEEVLLEQSKIVAQAAVPMHREETDGCDAAYWKLDGIAQACRIQKAEFLSVTEQVLSIRLFDERKDWEWCYRLGADDGKGLPVDVRAECEQFLARPPAGGRPALGGVWELLDLLNRRGEKEVCALLRAYCDRRFWEDFEAYPRDVDVLNHPSMTANWPDSIGRLVRSALPLARQDREIAGHDLRVRRVAYLGLAVNPYYDPKYKEFADEVERRLAAWLQIGCAAPVLTGKPWEVFLYIVDYAFPLAALPITRECHQAYRDFYRALVDRQIGKEHFQIPLHLSTGWEGKFEELEVYDDESARRAKGAREVLLFAPLLRVLHCTVERGRKEYGYTSGAPFWGPRRLGGRRDAVDALASDGELRATLLRAIAARELALAPGQLLAYYWVLRYLAADDEILPGAPESVILETRMAEILARGVFADPVGPAFGGLDNAARRDQARAACGALVEWGAVPVLAGLADWSPPAEAGG